MRLNFRPYQKETVDTAIKAFFEKGYDNVIIEAPTGFGKSLVNYLIAKHFTKHGKWTWYSTPQIVLLDQLENDKLIRELGGIAIIKGKDKYTCPVSRTPCNIAPCVLKKYYHCDKPCPYLIARENALESPISALSFAFLLATKDIEDWGQRDLLIVDEADDLESWAIEYATLNFRVNHQFNSIFQIINWAKLRLSNVRQKISFIENLENLSPKLIAELESLRKQEQKLTFFLNDAPDNPDNWAWRQSGSLLELKPINAGYVLNKTIWWRGKKRLITSATIISPSLFKQYTGLKGKTLFIRVPHPIPHDNRPIIYSPAGKMTREERKNTYADLIKKIEEIAEKHKNDKGLIHAHSYEIAREISKRLNAKGFKVIIHNSNDRNIKFQEFLNSTTPTIFISVGFERGIDLKYDLCRFQIITKIPFPDQSDIRVFEIWNKRKNWRWARYQAIKTLIQACGRIVRAIDDHGTTYILDKSFEHLLKYKKEFPSWFLDSIIFQF